MRGMWITCSLWAPGILSLGLSSKACAYYPSKYACQCPNLFHKMIEAQNLRLELKLTFYLIRAAPSWDQETMPFIHSSFDSLVQYLLILNTCYVLGALHSAKKTKKSKIQCLSTNLSSSSTAERDPLQYKLVALHCVAFWYHVGGRVLMVSWWPPLEKKGKESPSNVTPLNIFSHFKLT